jgi:transcriptional regulator with XRE-family HTH domain
MSKKPISFRERLDLARPDVVERRKRNRRKSAIALQLRVLRDGKGMTQPDVAQATDMAIQHIERMESLIGPIPDIKDLECYVDACGGDIKTVMLTGETDQPNDNSDSSSPD